MKNAVVDDVLGELFPVDIPREGFHPRARVVADRDDVHVFFLQFALGKTVVYGAVRVAFEMAEAIETLFFRSSDEFAAFHECSGTVMYPHEHYLELIQAENVHTFAALSKIGCLKSNIGVIAFWAEIRYSHGMFSRLLDYISRKLRMDAHYAARGGALLALSQVTSAVFGFVLTVAFANLLDPATYGMYRYVLSVYALLSLIELPGMDVAVTRAVSRGWNGAIDIGFRQKMRWGFLGTLVCFGIASCYYLHANFPLGDVFLICGAAMPFLESSEIVIAYLNGRKMFWRWTAEEMATQILSMMALIATMFITNNLVIIVLSYFIPYIAVRAGAYLLFYPKEVADEHRENIGPYARSMTIFQILNSAGSSLDQIVLFHFLGAAQVAVFSLDQAVPTRIQSLFKISGSLSLPKYAEREPDEIVGNLPYKMLVFGLIIFACCAVYVVFIPYFFMWFFPKYVASIPYTRALIFYTLAAITYPFSSYLLAHKKVTEYYLYGGVSLALKIAALVIFVPLFGIWGAVVSVLVSAASVLAVTVYIIVKYRKKSTREMKI